jgi:hypothetical protein
MTLLTILFGVLVVSVLSVLVGAEFCCVLVGRHSRRRNPEVRAT